MSVLCKAVVFLLLALPAVAQSQAFEVDRNKACSLSRPAQHAHASAAKR